jgi:predicted DNA-binding antitoxin AbrB/MazE fold protein
MTTQVEATFTNGVLRPDQPLPLADQARVRLTIEPVEEWSRDKSLAALASIQARLRERPVHGDGVRYTRDELHERR